MRKFLLSISVVLVMLLLFTGCSSRSNQYEIDREYLWEMAQKKAEEERKENEKIVDYLKISNVTIKPSIGLVNARGKITNTYDKRIEGLFQIIYYSHEEIVDVVPIRIELDPGETQHFDMTIGLEGEVGPITAIFIEPV